MPVHERAEIGIIGGSGLYDMQGLEDRQEVDVEIGFQAGADAYLVKPFSPLNLLNKVKAQLDPQ